MKNEIRQRVLEMRFKLSVEERKAASRKIMDRLFSLPEFKAARTVMFFASFRGEVETHDMIRRALAGGKRVILPKVKGKELALFEIRDFDKDTAESAWEIPEPVHGTQVKAQDLDFIVVPGAVFDGRGNRLGYGAGFYDRLLASYSGMTAALAFELQIVPQVPVSAHDVPVRKIVTEKRVIEASSKIQAPNNK